MSLKEKPEFAIFLDVDGVLVEAGMGRSWLEFTREIARYFDKPEQAEEAAVAHEKLFRNFLEKRASFEAIQKELIEGVWESLKGNKLHKKEIIEITKRMIDRMLPQATVEVINELQENPEYSIAMFIISSSFEIFIEMLARKLNIEHFRFNTEMIFEKDELIELNYTADEEMLKAAQIAQLIASERMRETIGGDRILLLDDELGVLLTQLGISLITFEDSKPELLEKATHTISQLSELKTIFKKLA